MVESKLQRQSILATAIDRSILISIFGKDGVNIRIEKAPDASEIIW